MLYRFDERAHGDRSTLDPPEFGRRRGWTANGAARKRPTNDDFAVECSQASVNTSTRPGNTTQCQGAELLVSDRYQENSVKDELMAPQIFSATPNENVFAGTADVPPVAVD